MTAAATASPTGPDDVAAYSLDNYVADALAVMDATDAGRRSWSAFPSAACSPASSRPTIPSASRPPFWPARSRRSDRRTIPTLTPRISRPSASSSRAGTSSTATTGWRIIPISPSTSSATSSPSRTRPSRSRTASAGPARPTARCWSRRWRRARIPPPFDVSEAMYRKIRCPVLIIHGDNDQIQPHARAQAVHAEVTRRGARHDRGRRPQSARAAIPAKCNALINDFLDRTAGHPRARAERLCHARQARSARSISPRRSASATAAATSPSRASCASCIRTCRSTGWRRTRSRACSKPAASASIRSARGLPARRGTSSWNAASTSCTASRRIRRMDEVLIANFMIFQDAVDEGGYDLVIADEAWDIDHYWHEHPELKKAKLAWFTDFVGYVPMPAGGEHEAFLTADYNAEMIEHIERHPGRARPRHLRRHARRHRAAVVRQGSAGDARLGAEAFRFRRLHHRRASPDLRQPRECCAKGWATAPTSGSASSRSAARASARTDHGASCRAIPSCRRGCRSCA